LTSPAAARAQLGVVFQSPSLDGKLTAVENLRHHGRLYGLAGKDLKNRINQWLAFFGLTERRSEFVERFSGGMRRKLEVAKALLHEPKLLLMDEPATGLDPAARRELWQKLLQLRKDKNMTIVLTTHLMDEAEHCDRLAIMAAGKLITVDTPDHLKSRIGGDVITLEPEPTEVTSGCHTLSANAAKCADSPEAEQSTEGTLCPAGQSVAPEHVGTSAADQLAADITARFGPWDDGAAPTVVDGRVRFEKPDGARLAAEAASTFPGRIRSLTVGRPTIEDAFMHLTGVGLGDGDR
jgi:ABC-2 type transport system ATP-binding protein